MLFGNTQKGKIAWKRRCSESDVNKDDHFIDVEYEDYEEYRKNHRVPKMKKITIKQGNLFSASEGRAVAHCVSQDLAMGKGIALQFKHIYGSVETLRQQQKNVGEVAELNLPKRNIYYLVTKSLYYEKPSYRSKWNALMDLRNCCEKHQNTLSAIPKIGYGTGGLAWEEVQDMIEFIFHNSNIELCVYEDTKIVATITLQKEGDIMMEPDWDRATLKFAQDKDIFCQEVIKLVKEEDAQEATCPRME
ncbi:hypothetical protein JTB14_038040 [Gonioctena quinquepunctata]|nr:hypothetical protein JTB14_038040 [Gonioctena quinquepunctata]